MITIKTPNERFNGVRAGLHFANGVATAEALTPVQRATVTRLGYTIEGDEPPAPEKTLDDMTVAELRDLAAERDVDLSGASKKAEILEVLRASESAGGEE